MPTKQKQIIIFSHGFGVRQDDRGLFTDIVKEIPECECVLFDYFKVDEIKKTITISNFNDQANKLKQIINDVKLANPGAIIDIIAHSQGTLIAALVGSPDIRRVILLAPVFDFNIERTLTRYRDKPGAIIDINGVSFFPGGDGLMKIIPADYWPERNLINIFQEYNSLSTRSQVLAIQAENDDILAKVDMTELDSNIHLISLPGDHGFRGSARPALIRKIRQYLLT